MPVEVEEAAGAVELGAAFCSVEVLGVEVVEEEDELLGVVVLLGEVVLWFISVEEVELELELDGVVLVLLGAVVLLGEVVLWSLGVVLVLGVVPVLVLLAPLGLVEDGVWLEAGGFAD